MIKIVFLNLITMNYEGQKVLKLYFLKKEICGSKPPFWWIRVLNSRL